MEKNKNLLVVLAHNNSQDIVRLIPFWQKEKKTFDFLIVDDASEDDLILNLDKYDWINYIKHEVEIGYGASFFTAYSYAKDFGYETVLLFDPKAQFFIKEVMEILENVDYGYDLVSGSRILENFDHKNFSDEAISITTHLAGRVNEITSFNLTDPLSGLKGIKVKALQEMEFVDPSHGVLLQLWIQAAFFNLNIIEIPLALGLDFGSELSLYDDPLGFFLTVIETEKYLYEKK